MCPTNGKGQSFPFVQGHILPYELQGVGGSPCCVLKLVKILCDFFHLSVNRIYGNRPEKVFRLENEGEKLKERLENMTFNLLICYGFLQISLRCPCEMAGVLLCLVWFFSGKA